MANNSVSFVLKRNLSASSVVSRSGSKYSETEFIIHSVLMAMTGHSNGMIFFLALRMLWQQSVWRNSCLV
jgi:hypothetical protein